MSLVEVLADCGGLAARLVEIHADDGSGTVLHTHDCPQVACGCPRTPGRCVVCSDGNQAARRVFPCNLRSLAVRALHLQAARAAGEALRKSGAGPAF